MQKIVLLTDSASDIPIELIKENNIKLLPFRVIYSNNEEYYVYYYIPEDTYQEFASNMFGDKIRNFH